EASTRIGLLAHADAIREKVKAAIAQRRGTTADGAPRLVQPKLTADVILPPAPRWAKARPSEPVICIGVSTAGTESLRGVLEMMPTDGPGLGVVQHMPEGFTATFAHRLDALCRIAVKEAADNDPVLPGHALIAPGNRHTLLGRRGDRYVVELRDGPLVCRHRP